MGQKTNLKIKTEWDLSLLYKSINDPKIEKDISSSEKVYKAFARKHKNDSKYMCDENALLGALSEYEKILELPIAKTTYYLGLSQSKNNLDEAVRARLNLVSQRLQKISNIILFFGVNLSKIPKPIQIKFLKSTKLKKYKYFLKQIFKNSKYVLTEPEEKILSLKSLPSHALWVSALSKMKSKLIVSYKGKKIPVPEAESLLREIKSQKERNDLHNKILAQYESLSDVAESELNAIVTDKKIEDELRGYTQPYEATILAYENDQKSVLNLIKTVTDNFPIAHRFYRIKKKMLGVQKLLYSDRAVPVGKTSKKIAFSDAYKIILEVFDSLDPEFGNILKGYVSKGQIDTYPKIGKSGGAYCAGIHKAPTFVLLNHTDNWNSLMTFAHEMGHAIHGELSSKQPAIYEDYSTSTAEVASTLFESFVFYNQFEKLSDKEKVVALHDKIQDDIATIFRQIACFNFELEMHNTIRKSGNMSKEELVIAMNKHMKNYIGDVEMSMNDGYFFVGWSHLRRFFYVYSYAFGQLASKALYKKYSEDRSYIEKIKKFLSLGGAMSPEDIFSSIGVDIKKPDFWKKGIQSIEEDIILLESLVNNK